MQVCSSIRLRWVKGSKGGGQGNRHRGRKCNLVARRNLLLKKTLHTCSPPELLLFNQSSSSGSSRAGHYNRSLPEVPNIEEIMEFMRESEYIYIKRGGQ